jgi:hypothetical protein
MAQPVGRRMPVSLARRFIGDLVHFAHKVPLCTLERTMRLGAVAAARLWADPRPGWCALFTKAYGLAAVNRPELRWAYIPYPQPHFYEHPYSVGSVAIERRIGNEDAVLFTHLRGPENQALLAIEAHLRRAKEDPIDSLPLFRRALKTSRWPAPLRRLVWWFGLNFSGHRRACHLGTFSVSVISAFGAWSVNLLTPVSTGINYGVLTPDGSLEVRLTYDHRVIDGGTVGARPGGNGSGAQWANSGRAPSAGRQGRLRALGGVSERRG